MRGINVILKECLYWHSIGFSYTTLDNLEKDVRLALNKFGFKLSDEMVNGSKITRVHLDESPINKVKHVLQAN